VCSTIYSCEILIKLKYLKRISKNTEKSNFVKIRLVGAEVFHADERTDMTTLTIAYRNFANAPQMASPALNTFQLAETRKIKIVIVINMFTR